MAKIMVKIEKEDINTVSMGCQCNIMLQCTNGIDLIFTRESLEELISDYNTIKDSEKIKTDI